MTNNVNPNENKIKNPKKTKIDPQSECFASVKDDKINKGNNVILDRLKAGSRIQKINTKPLTEILKLC